jgi:subtilase family serine protease
VLFHDARAAFGSPRHPLNAVNQLIEGSALNRLALAQKATPALALSVVLLASLAACGGGSPSDQTAQSPAASDTSAAATQSPAASDPAASDMQATDGTELDSTVIAALATTEALPAYHMAPALLDEPDQADVGGTNVSARLAPKHFEIDAAVADIDTSRLSRQALSQRISETSRARVASASGETTTPLSTAIIGSVHTPAQIRAAYGLPALPAVGAAISAATAASLGAGQTIYLLDAYHDATALSDLNAFSTRFGLPTCTNVAITTTTKLPLAAPPAKCTFSTVHSTTTGTMTTVAPAYNATWVPESKLDVQWAHAIAPLARIVLVELPSSMSNAVLGGNTLAGKMGAGVVSMSFGSAEAGWAPSTDSYFKGAGMTYVAAAGDSGTQVLWPAVSPNVVAVGGTSLNWSGSGTRYEAAWLHTGGGLSAYEALPAWQSGVTAAGGGALTRRAVPDVAFNANPSTGEYVALTLPGAATVWSAYGGTSIAAPQWAGIIAVANAMRVASAKPVLGDIHALLYKSIAAVPGTYAAAMGDVIDQATGWGTPNASHLLQTLTGVTTVQAVGATAPKVPAFSSGTMFSGSAGKAFAATLAATNPNGGTLRYTLAGAPSGLVAASNGAMSWPSPVAGSYTFTARVTDSYGYTATQTDVLTISAAAAATAVNHAPTIAATTLSEKAGATFAVRIAGSDADGNAMTYSMTGAPSGLTLMSGGILTWSSPVRGTYRLTVTVRDSHGATGTGVVTLIVA